MMNPARKRYIYLDSACGILLLHMIIGHCCQWQGVACYETYTQYTYCLSFFMPWFFYKAGYFFRQQPAKTLVRKDYKRLIVPFIVFSIVGFLVLGILRFREGELTYKYFLAPLKRLLTLGSVEGNLALWFLLSLFVVKWLYNLISNGQRRIRYLICLLILAIALSSYYLPENIHRIIPLYFYNIPLGFVFLWIGNKIKPYLNRAVNLLIAIAYIAIVIFMPTAVDMRCAQLIEGYWLMYIPSAVAGIVTINFLCEHILNFRNVFSYIGKNSMPYYVMHWIVLIIVRIFIPAGSAASQYYVYIAVASNLVILPIATILIRKLGLQYVFGE